jgi:hypothetical protein
VKIVGGSVVSVDTDPVMHSTVALIGNGSICTGTLIGPNQIITAAHCLTNTFGLKIASGTNPTPTPGLRIIKVRKHPRWSQGPFDVGIVVFEGTLPPNLRPVAITPLGEISSGQQTILAGYGVTGEVRSDSGTLRKVTARIKNFQTLDKEFSMQEGLGVGSCYGDSGGPAYIELNGVLTVIGATSRGNNCDSGDGIYGDVRYFQGWFKCTAKEFGKPLKILANDTSNVDCLPGTIDTDVSNISDNSSNANAYKIMIGEAGSISDSFVLYFSALKTNTASSLNYCLGKKEECSAANATWHLSTLKRNTFDRTIFSSGSAVPLSNGLIMSIKSESQNNVVEEIEFKSE